MYYYTGPQGTDVPQGPYDLTQLRYLRDTDTITDLHLVAKDGDTAWRTLREVLTENRTSVPSVKYIPGNTVPAGNQSGGKFFWIIGAVVMLSVFLFAKGKIDANEKQAEFRHSWETQWNRVQDAINRGDTDAVIARSHELVGICHEYGESAMEADARSLEAKAWERKKQEEAVGMMADVLANRLNNGR